VPCLLRLPERFVCPCSRMADGDVDARLYGRSFSSRALQEGRSGTIEELHERGLLPTNLFRYGNAAPRLICQSHDAPGSAF